MAMILGSAEWEARQGRIGRAQRWRYLVEAVRTRLRIMATVPRKTGHKLERMDLDRVVLPDSTCARAAVDQLEALGSPAIIQHSLRTYIWGSLLGQLDGRHCDAELLYVSAMLHDLGLSEHGHGCSPGQCFTLDGVQAGAAALALTTAERAEKIRRAVLLHLNIAVPGELHGWEAHYLQAGASLDVIGQRFRDLPADAVRATLQGHPRFGLKEELAGWVRREAALRPHSRMALLKRLGFVGLVRAAPFDS